MTRKLPILTAFLVTIFSFSQNTFVPDDKFETMLISRGYDSGVLDDFVETSSIDTITSLSIVGFGIADLTGIEDFVALKKLECGSNEFTSIDISNNTELTYLDFAFSKITNIDITSNVKLDTLRFYNGLISEIDLSKNTLLRFVEAFDNEISSLDISQNTKLLRLNCNNNAIPNMDISKNLELEWLSCSSNQISSIDTSNNINLKTLAIASNLLTELDVSKNLNLERLVSSVNDLNELDIRANKKLTYLICNYNNLSELDLSQNTMLSVYFSCSNNNLISLDVSKNPLLTDIHCSFNQIEDLDVSNNLLLESISCSANNLTSLDLSNNPNLKYVSCRFSKNLENFNIQNGNNDNLERGFYSLENPKLACVQVDNVAYSQVNWSNIDAHTVFSENCSTTLSNDDFNEFEFTFYPNPIEERIHIYLQQKAEFAIFTLSGKQVKIGSLNSGSNELNISELKPGVYFFNLKNEIINSTRKIVKL